MTHTRQLADHEGDFSSWSRSSMPCPNAESGPVHIVEVRTWESHDGAYEDEQFRCSCGHVWWIDGIDS